MEIKLRGASTKYVIIDDEDYAIINKYKWYEKHGKYTNYAETRINPKTTILMHRMILKPKKLEQIDHIDGNGLNNRKYNLRICNNSLNMINRHNKKTKFTSQYIGVSFDKEKNKWTAYFRTKKIGRYNTEKEALLAYQQKKDEYLLKLEIKEK